VILYFAGLCVTKFHPIQGEQRVNLTKFEDFFVHFWKYEEAYCKFSNKRKQKTYIERFSSFKTLVDNTSFEYIVYYTLVLSSRTFRLFDGNLSWW